MFRFDPHYLTPTYSALGGWRGVGDMSDNAFGLEDPATQKKAATNPALRKTHLLPLTAGLTPVQKAVVRHMVTRQKEEKHLPANLAPVDVNALTYPAGDTSSRLDAWQLSYLTLVANSDLNLTEKMQCLGLAWYDSLSRVPNPIINVDEIALFNERADANPSGQFARVVATQDPVERSRLGLLFNRWLTQWVIDHPQKPLTLEKTVRWAPHQDLSYLNLKALSLTESNFDFVDATGVIGEAADLSYSSLKKARLQAANLRQANLEACNLKEADLLFAVLQSASLSEADCTDADFTGANLDSVKAYGTIFDRAHMGGVNGGAALVINNLKCGSRAVSYTQLTSTFDGIQDTRFHETQISNLRFENCDFSRADFNEATFDNVVFHGCNFPHAVMKNCTFRGRVVFEYCDFENFTGFENWNIKGEVILRMPLNLPVSQQVLLKRAGFTINHLAAA